MDELQAENGHVDIANGIVEALCRTQLSGYESRVLWALFRKTYGWHKKEDRISLSQFQVLVGLPIPKISNTLNRLVLRKMVSVTENGNGKVKCYGFQKVFTLWQDLPEKVLPKIGIPEKGITENRAKGLPISASTKETITKETTTAARTRTESIFLECFEEKEDRLRQLFPQHNFEVVKETCVAHFRSQPPPIDPYAAIVKWFGREQINRQTSSTPQHVSLKVSDQMKVTQEDRDNYRRAMERAQNG